MIDTFFKDLVVVELAGVLAGPAVGMFFAELGARVVKIENERTGGDLTRQWKVPEEAPGNTCSAYWCSVNWGKEVLFSDLSTAAGQGMVLELVGQADVLICNFKPASAKRLGLDYDALRARFPSLIYAQINGFGEQNDTPAFDVVLQAEAGYLYMCGEPDGQPVKMPVALIDLMAAHQLKEGILLALMHRHLTGQGSFVKTSLFESAVAALANQASNWLMAGHLPQRMGTLHQNIAPYGDIFYAKDGKPVVLAVGTDEQFNSLCVVLGLPNLAEDKRFSTNALRVRNRQDLIESLTPGFLRFAAKELLETFRQQGVPAGVIRNMQEVFEIPAAHRMILEDALPGGGFGRRVKTVAFDVVTNRG